MKKIYILVEVDLQSYGYSKKNALVFTDIEKAKEKMREMYLEAFKKYYEKYYGEKDPYEKDNDDYEFCDTYCEIWGSYYLDIFTKSIED